MAVSPTLTELLRCLEEAAGLETKIPEGCLGSQNFGKLLTSALLARLADRSLDVLTFLERSPELEKEGNLTRTKEVLAKLRGNSSLAPETRAAMSELLYMVTTFYTNQAKQASA